MIDWDSVIYFVAVSLPEQLLMAAFAWLILGKFETVKLRNVFGAGAIAAVSFYIIKILISNFIYSMLLQVTVFAVVIFFVYRLNLIEMIIGCLMTSVVFGVAQGTTVNTVFLLTGWTKTDFDESNYLAIANAMVYFMVMILICYVFYRANINIHYLREKTRDKLYTSRIRFLILQLVFGYFNLFIIYTLFFNNINVSGTVLNKALIVLCLVLNILFTVILVKSVFKMGDVIQKEEELKRKYDGREILQNINYISSLIDSKEYEEVKRFLESMKNDVDDKIVSDKDGTNRTN